MIGSASEGKRLRDIAYHSPGAPPKVEVGDFIRRGPAYSPCRLERRE
jgi:hypothetical protein